MGRDLIEEYRQEVERIFGADLVSLTLYGSHAHGAPDPGREVSALIVLREIRKDALRAYRDVALRYAKRGIPVPPVFTEEFLRESTDVFPLEFLAMSEHRRVLSGRDVVVDLPVTTENLRHQVEFELKGKLLALRRRYMAAEGSRGLADLVLSTAGSVVSVARGLLLLAGPDAPHGKEEILDALERTFGVRLAALREAVGARRAGKVDPARAEDLAFDYIAEVESLCDLADRFPTPPGR